MWTPVFPFLFVRWRLPFSSAFFFFPVLPLRGLVRIQCFDRSVVWLPSCRFAEFLDSLDLWSTNIPAHVVFSLSPVFLFGGSFARKRRLFFVLFPCPRAGDDLEWLRIFSAWGPSQWPGRFLFTYPFWWLYEGTPHSAPSSPRNRLPADR